MKKHPLPEGGLSPLISRDEIRSTASTHIYVFGDNLQQRGYGGQAAAARGEPNAFGVPTKKAPFTYVSSYFSDAEYEANCQAISAAIALIPKDGRKIVIMPGIGEGRAELPQRAPKTWKFLQKALQKALEGN